MKKKRIILIVPILTSVLVTLATAKMYQYTDKNGVIVITDNPAAGSNAGEVKMKNDRVFRSAPRRSEPAPPADSAPAEEQRRKRGYSDVNVVMYMTSW
ncbi:MAG TPA: DUF4124 domain-containing protein [Nitrospirota bacterium]|nr:DUF4124 domain-containing protein [Nitrospirota bacterium]